MRRWNGWGEETTVVELPDNGRGFLAELVGPGLTLPDATLEQVLAKVPASRLPEHPLVVREARDRLLHARGQSLPDWLAMREGEFGVVPDGVAYPQTAEQIRELLSLWQNKARASADVKSIALGHVDALNVRIAELTEMRDTLQMLAACCKGNDRPDCPILQSLAQPPGKTLV